MTLAVKTVTVTLGYLIGAMIVGIIACSIADILPMRFASIALFYGIWFVVGVFCGVLIYESAGDWVMPKAEPTEFNVSGDWGGRRDSMRAGMEIFATANIALMAICAALYTYVWDMGGNADDYSVPFSFSHSVVFFLAVEGGLIVGRYLAMPVRKGPIQ